MLLLWYLNNLYPKIKKNYRKEIIFEIFEFLI